MNKDVYIILSLVIERLSANLPPPLALSEGLMVNRPSNINSVVSFAWVDEKGVYRYVIH